MTNETIYRIEILIEKTNYKNNKRSGDSFIKAERGKRIN